MNKPHKWAKEIIAWANGAKIEWKNHNNDWKPKLHDHWYDDGDYEYRIKPQPKKPQYLYVYNTEEEIKLGTIGSAIPIKNLNGKYEILGKIKLED